MALVSYPIPNLSQGISQQPDAQRDPSQGEIQVNGMSSIMEGLRKRDASELLAEVSNSSFGDCFIHSILRDNVEEYLAVVASSSIKVYDLEGNSMSFAYRVNALNYISSLTDAKQNIRAVTIADYTFISNTTKVPAMKAATAPATARPSTHEAMVWVRGASYGNEYKLTVNGVLVTVTTAVAPVIAGTDSEGDPTVTENRIGTADIAERLMNAFYPGSINSGTGLITTGYLTIEEPTVTQNTTATSTATTTDGLGTGLTLNVTMNGSRITSLVVSGDGDHGTNYVIGDKIYVPGTVLGGSDSISTSPKTDATDYLTNQNPSGVTINATTNGTVTTTNGTGTGLKLDLSMNGSALTGFTIDANQNGSGYAIGDKIYVKNNVLDGRSDSINTSPAKETTLYLTNETPSGVTENTTTTNVTTTTDGSGSGLKLDLIMDGSALTEIKVSSAVADHGNGYAVGDQIKVAKNILDGGSDTTAVHIATVKKVDPITDVHIATVKKIDPLITTPVHIATVTNVDPATPGTINGQSISITRSGSVLWLQSSSAITLAATDARANADITAILSKVQTFTELPTIAPNGYQIEIEGDPGNNFDGYYVEFVPKSGTFGEGLWVETVSPGVEYEIDEDTMPHILVRLPDSSFFFGPADGYVLTGTTNGVAWEVKMPTWGQRAAGDYDTAPDPSFIGHAINDIFIYKNRLGFLADENVILSRVREFFNFWPETVTTILDSDPIDVVASNNKVSVLRYAVPYQDELILFSSQYQFRFNAAETVLTPATAQITVLTQFETDVAVRPQQSGGGIVFAQSNGDWAQFREFSVRGAGTALTADAADLSGYVSAYVPSGLFKLTVNDTSNAIFGISSKTGHKNRIYVYKYFVRNTGQGVERAQSSWSHWELTGADEILQILCVRETLYTLVRYGTKVYLEKIPVMDRLSEPVAGAPYPFLLDRRVSTTTATPAGVRVSAGSYDATTKKTTWTLPYSIASRTEAWSGFDTSANGGVLLGYATSGNTIIGNGDWSGSPVWFGESYNFRYRFTRFKLYKEIGGGKAAANVERTQVRNAKLRYHETHYFEIHVFPEGRDVGKYKFDGTILGSRNSTLGTALPNGWDSDDERFYEGVFTFPIMSRGERCMVEIHNDTPHPCKFSTCEWVALITSKARSLR